MKVLLSICLALTIFIFPAHGVSFNNSFIVSGYNKRMELFSIEKDGLKLTGGWPVALNLSWVEQQDNDPNIFWAIHEVNEYENISGGAISRWEVDSNGELKMKEWLSIRDPGPAHLLVDLTHRLAFTANYAAGTLTVFQLTKDLRLARLLQTEHYGAGCLRMSHPHEAVRMGDILWVMDLGCDKIWHYRINESGLARAGQTQVPPGNGPRHMAIHPNRNLAFVSCELKNYVEMYSFNSTTGNLTHLQQIELTNIANNTGAEIAVSDDGNFVYVSSRGVGMIVVYQLVDNILVKLEQFKLKSTWPRSFAIKPNVLDQMDAIVVADQMGDKVELLWRHRDTGRLTSSGLTAKTQHQPAFVNFVKLA